MAFQGAARCDKDWTHDFLRFIAEFCGEDAVKIVEILLNEEEANDDLLAEKSGMRLNQVRRILYDLLDKQIVAYRRNVDEEKGYYVYTWSLKKERVAEIIRERKRLVLNRLRERLRYEEQNMFFTCPNSCVNRVPFDKALEHQFKCPKCSAMLQIFDNSQIVCKLRLKVEALENELK
ncbi:MAG: transcription factor [Thermoproteota archaeon]